MDIWSFDKLLLFIGFVIPGFVSLKTYELLFSTSPKESPKQLVDAVAYSCLNYALLFLPIFSIEDAGVRKTSPHLYAVFYLFVLFIAPVSWVCILRKLRSTQFFQGVMPHPTQKPWDYVFAQRRPFWIIVTLKDRTKIAGKFGSSSFASNAPVSEQIYLEETWVLNTDGGFERPRVETAGIIILATDIVTVELFNITYGGNDERQKDDANRGIPAGGKGLSTESNEPAGPTTERPSGGGVSAAVG